MSSSNQRPANRGFRSVLRCAITYYRQVLSLFAPEPSNSAAPLKINPSTHERLLSLPVSRPCADLNVAPERLLPYPALIDLLSR